MSSLAQKQRSDRVATDEGLVHPFQVFVDEMLDRHQPCNDGEVATYIPELGKANPDWFGIAIATVDGHVYHAGAVEQPFTIQSISKPFVYGLALHDHGLETVMRHVGVEPSGDAFNSISLDPKTGRPLNPMINAGAITSAGLIKGSSPEEKFARVLGMFSGYAGRPLRMDEDVYQSESATGFRNRAIANLLRNFDMIAGDPDEVAEVYFQQCSVLMDCRDLAITAATLAAGGVSPVTRQRVLDETYVEHVLSVMSTCGMYDYAGEWVFRIGMPAKSGVAGGIIGVLPGQMGVAVFSPRLDHHGNSVRGIRVFEDLATMLGLHMFHRADEPATCVRTNYQAHQVHSKRMRRAEQMKTLAQQGWRIDVWELQGHLTLAGAESAVRRMMSHCGVLSYLVLDLRRVAKVDESAAAMLAQFARDVQRGGRPVIFSHAERHAALLAALRATLVGDNGKALHTARDTDEALEWCEDRILAASGAQLDTASATLEQFDLVGGLDTEQIDVLRALLRPGSAASGEWIIRQGEKSDSLYFLTRGDVSIILEPKAGEFIRLATCSPIMTFGEMALLQHKPRSTSVRADGDCEFLVLSLSDYEMLQQERPDIAMILLRNFAVGLSEKLRRANMEISALGR